MLPDLHTAMIIGKARQDDWLREADRHQLLHSSRATRSGNRRFRLWRRSDGRSTPILEPSRTPTREPAM
jgi:hypothetical protein